jgi:hypothetical protein
MGTSPSPIPDDKTQLRINIGLHDIISSIMMICATSVVLELARRFVPDWHSEFLLPLSFFIALEALFSYQIAKDLLFPSPGWLLHHLTELVVMLAVVKVVLYLVNGSVNWMSEFALWQKDFFQSFFTLEYTVIVLYLLLVWRLSGLFTQYLGKLETDWGELEAERQGYIKSDRTLIRQHLITLIFIIGAVMLLATAATHFVLPFYIGPFESRPLSAVLLVVYFLLGFVLLSQSQYSLLRARWYLQGIPIQQDVSHRWAPFSIIMLLIATLGAFLLPTRYSQGFLEVLKSIILIALGAISTFFSTLIALFMALFANLFGGKTGPPPPSAEIPTAELIIPKAAAIPTQPAEWLQFAQNLIFWVVFIAIIIFAFRYYLKQNQSVLVFFKNMLVWSGMRRFWDWLRHGFIQLNRAMATMVKANINRLQTITRGTGKRFDPILAISQGLPPRQRILLIYLAMVHWNSRHGIYRKGSETPYEYAASLRKLLPDDESDIHLLTQSFMEARYTRHEITRNQANIMQAAWERFKDNLQRYLEPQP